MENKFNDTLIISTLHSCKLLRMTVEQNYNGTFPLAVTQKINKSHKHLKKLYQKLQKSSLSEHRQQQLLLSITSTNLLIASYLAGP